MILPEQFQNNWRKQKAGDPHAVFLLAVSGGEDSMVMADLFLRSDIRFAVAHCNFGLRGDAADGDERFVQAWCAANSIVFHSVKFDTKQKSAEWKKGIQETARILRYEWFELIRAQHNYSKIVTAHHANDNVETLLINLFKGTGISGLHGILPDSGNITRPLLFATKEEISGYAIANNIAFREDASNAGDDYLRNAVRHNIVPAIEKLFPHAVNNVNESISRFADAELLYKKAIAIERKKLMEPRGRDYYIPILKLKHHQPINTICYELLQPFGFSAAQSRQVLRLLDAESGHFVASDTHRVIRNRDFLVVTSNPAEEADLLTVAAVPCSINTGKYLFKFSIQQAPSVMPGNEDEVYLDLKEISFPLLLRKRRAGDYFYPLGMGMKKKKVSRLLVDAKIPLHEKEELRLLEINKRIAWVPGLRLDERFRIRSSTRQVLVVKRSLNKH